MSQSRRTTLLGRIARSSRYTVAVSAVALSLAFVAEPALAKTRITPSFYEVNKSIDLLGDVYKEVAQNYVEPVDVSQFMYAGIDGMLCQLDPYTTFLDQEQSGELEEITSGQYAGIGITIGTIGGELFVTSVFEGQAAAKAGLQVGDQIVAVNGQRVGERPIEEVRGLIKGTAGTPVTLTVRKDGRGANKEYAITRSEVRVSTVSYAGLFGPAGYIRMSSFARHSRPELVAAINAVRQGAAKKRLAMSGIVLDLRGNPGGLLTSAVDVAALFVEKGSRVVSTKGRAANSQQTYVTTIDPLVPSLPLVVLIDGDSASASEIVAGAIQELDRGVIVGESSFGKGLVQSIILLPYDHTLKLTTAKYYTPSGRLIQKPLPHGKNHCPDDGERKVLAAPQLSDSTKVYYTRNRRKVYGGGGIRADLPVSPVKPPEYEKAVKKEGLLFSFATNFHHKHPGASVQKLATTPVFGDFREFVRDRKFVFRSEEQQKLDSLKTMIRKETGQSGALDGELEAFDQALADWTMQRIAQDSLRITTAVQREIIRHYSQQAALRHEVEHDPVARRAFELLADPASYQKLLKP